MRALLSQVSILFMAIAILPGCTSKDRQTAEILCHQRAASWARLAMLNDFSNKDDRTYAFSEKSDEILLHLPEAKNADSFANSEVEKKKLYLESIKTFGKAEPKYFDECMTLTTKVLKECNGASDSDKCVTFYDPKFAELEQRHNKFTQQTAARKAKTEKLIEIVKRDDLEALSVELGDFSNTPQNQALLGELIGAAIDNGSTRIVAKWVNKNQPEAVKATVKRLMGSTEREWTEGQKKTIQYLKPIVNKAMIDEAVPFDDVEKLVNKDEVAKINTLIDLGLNIKRKNKLDEDIVTIATDNARITVLQELLKKGVNVEYTDRLGRSLLHMAVDNRDIEVVKFLIKKGANPNRKKYGTFGDTAIHEAKESGNEDLIKVVR